MHILLNFYFFYCLPSRNAHFCLRAARAYCACGLSYFLLLTFTQPLLLLAPMALAVFHTTLAYARVPLAPQALAVFHATLACGLRHRCSRFLSISPQTSIDQGSRCRYGCGNTAAGDKLKQSIVTFF